MIKVGIAIDARKGEIYKRHLGEAGFSYDEAAIDPGVTMLIVMAESSEVVAPIVAAAETECSWGRLQ